MMISRVTAFQHALEAAERGGHSAFIECSDLRMLIGIALRAATSEERLKLEALLKRTEASEAFVRIEPGEADSVIFPAIRGEELLEAVPLVPMSRLPESLDAETGSEE
jgi:hypothetical protein